MADRLSFDDRLLNKYAVEDLEASHPPLFVALSAWFVAFGDFDDVSIDRLAAAKSPADIAKWKPKAEAALKGVPAIVATLDRVITELDAALGVADNPQFQALREAATVNRKELAERAPAIVSGAASDSGDYESRRIAATKTLEGVARAFADLRTQSADTSRDYRALQPLVVEMKMLWERVGNALSALSREDQRAVRAPFDGAMRDAARTISRNAFLRKMRDQASGLLARPVVRDSRGATAERFAAALARGDFTTAYALLAPWIASEWPAERLANALQESALAGAQAAGLDVAPPPAGYRAETAGLSLEMLAQHRTLPSEITATTYRGWYSIQIETDEEDAYLTDIDYLAALHVAVVETPAGERIGAIAISE